MPRTIGGTSLLEAYGCSRLAVAKAYILGKIENDSFIWDVISTLDIAAAEAAIRLERELPTPKPQIK